MYNLYKTKFGQGIRPFLERWLCHVSCRSALSIHMPHLIEQAEQAPSVKGYPEPSWELRISLWPCRSNGNALLRTKKGRPRWHFYFHLLSSLTRFQSEPAQMKSSYKPHKLHALQCNIQLTGALLQLIKTGKKEIHVKRSPAVEAKQVGVLLC